MKDVLGPYAKWTLYWDPRWGDGGETPSRGACDVTRAG